MIGFDLMRFRKLMTSVFLLTSLQLEADEEATYRPVYAGTLLNFYSQNAAPGRLVFEPILFATRSYGFYNKNWNLKNQTNTDEVELLLSLETGITKFLDINLNLTGIYSYTDGQSSVRYEDTSAILGFQIANDVKDTWTPDFRILLGESFPTGKYDQLNPKKLESDASGSGSFETFLILVLQKIFYTFPKHPFNLNLNLYYIYPSDVETRGFSVYGGGYGTKGTVNPGSQYIASLGVEITLEPIAKSQA